MCIRDSPMTHLITLNQSDNEMKEDTMRLYVAKSRFFKKGMDLIENTNDKDVYKRQEFQV